MENENEYNPQFFVEPTWAIIELMGHQTIAGQITEVQVAGCPMLRVDVPAVPADAHHDAITAYTRFFGAKAVYSIIPTDELSAHHAVAHLRARPVSPYVVPVRAIAAPRDDDDYGDRPF